RYPSYFRCRIKLINSTRVATCILAQPNGPYPSAELNFWVRKGTPGVFVLSRDGKDFEILGTATISLRSTIQEFLEQKNEDWFAFSYALSPARQFNVECEWYNT